MIKSLVVKNFQSHRETDLEFDPGLNVILGQSDSGKTSILRALRWLIWNRPSGDDMRSTWGGDTIVDIDVNNGQVQRIRTKKDNLYLLGHHDEFKAMGTDVPAEVQQLLNINEINLQQQLDSPFLLTSSPGEVATHFNKIAKLDKIDVGLKNVNSWIRDIVSTTKHKEADLKAKEVELKDYDHLEKFEAEVEVLEDDDRMLTMFSKNKYDLTGLIADIAIVVVSIEEVSEAIKDEQLVNNTIDLIYKRDGLEDGPIATIKELINQIADCKEEIEDIKQLTANEQQVKDLLESVYLSIQKEQGLITINDLLEEISDTERDITVAGSTIRNKQRQFDESFPNSCPLCGSNVKFK